MTEAETGKPDAFDSAIRGWRDALAALRAMPMVAAIAFIVLLALNAATLPFMQVEEGQSLSFGMQLFSFMTGIVQGFLMTPVAIAVHRYVLLGETTQYYLVSLSDPRFMRFFVFTVVFQFLMGVPGTMMGLGALGGTGGLIIAVIGFVLLIIAFIVALRMLILFPAIAVDAPNADWRNALDDTKGHTWRVFFIMVLTSLPILVVQFPLYFTLALPDGPSFAGGFVLAVAQAALGTLGIAALAAVASRLYLAFGTRLGRPAGLQRLARGGRRAGNT
jgi:hypothetical protein